MNRRSRWCTSKDYLIDKPAIRKAEAPPLTPEVQRREQGCDLGADETERYRKLLREVGSKGKKNILE